MADQPAQGQPAQGQPAQDWSAASYSGSRRVLRRVVATTSARERMDWLEQALRFAQTTGVLARAHRLRQQRCDATWEAPADSGAPPAG